MKTGISNSTLYIHDSLDNLHITDQLTRHGMVIKAGDRATISVAGITVIAGQPRFTEAILENAHDIKIGKDKNPIPTNCSEIVIKNFPPCADGNRTFNNVSIHLITHTQVVLDFANAQLVETET